MRDATVSPLAPHQRDLLTSWLGRWELVADHSWPLQDTTVVRLRCPDAAGSPDVIVKASTTSHHIRREIQAYAHDLGGLTGLDGLVPTLRHASAEDGILVVGHLPGALVQGTRAEWEPDTYHQAGRLLTRLHQPRGVSVDHAGTLARKTSALLPRSAGLVPRSQLRLLETELGGLALGAVPLAVTHGDYQPRNWLVHEGVVRVIDFGRAAHRTWTSDLVRLQHQQFVGHPELEDAFFDGYGRRPAGDELSMLRLENLHQALGTVVWAHEIGDAAFESHGRRMLDRLL